MVHQLAKQNLGSESPMLSLNVDITKGVGGMGLGVAYLQTEVQVSSWLVF